MREGRAAGHDGRHTRERLAPEWPTSRSRELVCDAIELQDFEGENAVLVSKIVDAEATLLECSDFIGSCRSDRWRVPM